MGPGPPGNWLAAQRPDLTFGMTAICIFVSKFYGRKPFLSPTRETLSAVQELHLYPTDLDCLLHRWYHELVALFCWITATAPESRSVDSLSRVWSYVTVTQVVWQASFWHSCHILVLCKGQEKTPGWVTLPGKWAPSTHILQVVPVYMVTSSETNLDQTRPIWTWPWPTPAYNACEGIR